MKSHSGVRFWTNAKTMDLTTGNPFSQIAMFAFPVFISQLFQQLYNTADTLIVGKFLGTEALAAVSSSGNLIFLLVSFFTGTALGAGVVIGRYFGAQNYSKVSRAIHTDLAFGITCGLVLTVFGVVMTPTFLVWMQTDEAILPQAIEYFRYYFFGSLFMVMYNICRSIMNALGDSRRPLYYLIFSSVLNIVLDLLFVGVLGFGVGSAAVATAISQGASVILCMIHLCRKGEVFTVELRKIRFHKDILLEIIKYGLPSGVQSSVIGFANVMVQSQINSFGEYATAAYGSYIKLEGFAFLPVTSYNMALTAFVSQNLGAMQYDRAKQGARFGVLASLGLSELIGVFFYLFAPSLISIFDTNATVVELGATEMRTACLFYCLLAVSHAYASILQGAGKAVIPMCVMLSVWCVFRIFYILLVMHLFHEIRYIYWAYPLTWSISSIIYFIYYHTSDWVHGFEKRSTRTRQP